MSCIIDREIIGCAVNLATIHDKCAVCYTVLPNAVMDDMSRLQRGVQLPDRGWTQSMSRFAMIVLGGFAVLMATAGMVGAFSHGGPGACIEAMGPVARPNPGTACGLQPAPGADHGAALTLALSTGMGGMATPGANVDRKLTVASVRTVLSARLAMGGNPRLTLGEVTARDADTIIAEVVTVDKALVDRFSVNRKTGRFTRI